MKSTTLTSMTAAMALAATAAAAVAGESTTGSHIKRLETVVARTIAEKPPVDRLTTGSRIKRLADVSVLSDADKTGRAGQSSAPADVEALLADAAAAEAGN